jgi:hypothetical protein
MAPVELFAALACIAAFAELGAADIGTTPSVAEATTASFDLDSYIFPFETAVITAAGATSLNVTDAFGFANGGRGPVPVRVLCNLWRISFLIVACRKAQYIVSVSYLGEHIFRNGVFLLESPPLSIGERRWHHIPIQSDLGKVAFPHAWSSALGRYPLMCHARGCDLSFC